jgi:serine/threonine-protein kinase
MIEKPTKGLRPFQPREFGRYTLLAPLAAGGMGEVFLARMSGAGGFEKTLVIKKILPQLAMEQDFVDRFLNEAHILVQLHHGSIAQVLDMGELDGEFYIALEFVDGKDLRKVATKCKERGHTLPLGLALFVMVRVLDALAYAHRKKGEGDKDLNLVHRDVSPQNVLISYEGEVKVIDFGLAKSSLQSGRTNPSMILGKFFYMAPEQAKHTGVDKRSDLYAVGICLYELIAGKNPFEGLPQVELISAVANPKIEPLAMAMPGVPPAIEALVMKALAPDPKDRFATAEEMRGRLTAAMLELDPAAGPESLAQFMRVVFSGEFGNERRLFQSLRAAVPQPAPVAVNAAGPSTGSSGTFVAARPTRDAPGNRAAPVLQGEVVPASFAPTNMMPVVGDGPRPSEVAARATQPIHADDEEFSFAPRSTGTQKVPTEPGRQALQASTEPGRPALQFPDLPDVPAPPPAEMPPTPEGTPFPTAAAMPVHAALPAAPSVPSHARPTIAVSGVGGGMPWDSPSESPLDTPAVVPAAFQAPPTALMSVVPTHVPGPPATRPARTNRTGEVPALRAGERPTEAAQAVRPPPVLASPLLVAAGIGAGLLVLLVVAYAAGLFH